MNNEAEIQQQNENNQLDTMGVDMALLLDEFNLSKSYVEQYTRDFPQLDNLVDGIPLNKDDDAPFVGDTTLAGLVRSIPRNSLQQLPVLSVTINGTKNSIPALLATYLLKKTAFNEDTFGKGLLSTLQIGAEQALTHGYAPFMVATGQMYNDFGTTMRLLHYTDTSPEPGIQDHNETGFDYVIANLTPSRVRKILEKARNNPDTTWNVPALEQVLQSTPRAKSYSIYESDARRNSAGDEAGPTYMFVTRYPVGEPFAPIATFCPEVTEAPLRVMKSRSRWGYPRVQYLVIDPAALIPFGISRVRLASPNQNLMNIYLGNIAAMLLLNSKPPILKRGRFIKPVTLEQGVVWETLDQNATAELKTLDNGALGSFGTFAQQFAGQIQNIMGGQTLTVGPGAKGSAFGKTAPGEKRSQDYMDVSTNQITKILENFLRQYGLVALDTLLSEQEGEDHIIVDDDTMNAINQLRPGTIGDDHKILIQWERFYEAIEEWSVTVDVSLSPDELKDQKRGDIQDMMVVLAQNAQEIGPEAVEMVKKLTNMLLQDSVPLAGQMSTMGPSEQMETTMQPGPQIQQLPAQTPQPQMQ